MVSLIERIKQAYLKTGEAPFRRDCYHPFRVLFKAENDTQPTSNVLQEWMISLFGNEDKLNGFLIGFGCDIEFSPSNGKNFSDGFYQGRELIKKLIF